MEGTNHVESIEQEDSRAYLVHSWLKHPKFAHASATGYASKMVGYGLVISGDETIELVKKHDAILDPLFVRDFCGFCGYTEKEFWKIIDNLYNTDLFTKDEYDRWMIKDPIWKTNNV